MAFHLHEGEPGQELSHATTDIVVTGPQAGRRENVTVNVFWPADREDLALDTRNTLSDASILAHLRPDEDMERSWLDYHFCMHDVGGPCPAPEWRWP
jgi:hypothetical protein